MSQVLPDFLRRLLEATNAHDPDRVAACFTGDYRNETPVHPGRGFTGREQVRTNWQQIFTFVPDVRAAVEGYAVDEARIWSEWEMSGIRLDGSRHLMRGVIVFALREGLASWARFYLEPVDDAPSTIDETVDAQVHAGDRP